MSTTVLGVLIFMIMVLVALLLILLSIWGIAKLVRGA